MAELTNTGLQEAAEAMETLLARRADRITEQASVIDEDARDTTRVAEQLGAKSVDRDSVAETHELARITAGLSDGILAYAAAGQDTARLARAVGDQTRESHDGIQEAINRSPVDNIHDLDADWLEQE